MKHKIVYVDSLHIRSIFGDMDFNIFHAYGISFHSPWYILPGEILIEKRVKDEFSFLLKTEKLERELNDRYPENYNKIREILKRRLCKPTKKNFIRKTYKHNEFTVREVDGGIIRKSLDPDFVSGGHYLVYSDYIPKGEIWLDGKLDPRELPYILTHESTEAELMRKGATYIHAHDKAIHAEKHDRINSGKAYFLLHNSMFPLPFITALPNKKKRILITAGIHGDEPAPVAALARALREPENSEFLLRYPVDIFPLLNPEGYALGTRENSEDQDLNRYFGNREQIDEPEECILLKEFFVARKKYALHISLHEDPEQKSFYLYATQFSKKSNLIQSIFRVVNNFHIPLYNGIDDPELKNEIKNGYYAVSSVALPDTTLEEYLTRNKKVEKTITLEIPGKLPLDKKINLTENLLKVIASNF